MKKFFVFVGSIFVLGICSSLIEATNPNKETQNERIQFHGKIGNIEHTFCYKPSPTKKSTEHAIIPQTIDIPYITYETRYGILIPKIVSEPTGINERVLKADTRTMVANPSSWPHCMQGLLVVQFGSDKYIGSGTMIGPRYVLTAGHNLLDNGRRPTKISFYPGMHNKHFSYTSQGQVEVPIKYVNNVDNEEGKSHDYGLVILDEPLGHYVGWAGVMCLPDDDTVVKFMESHQITVTGYPADKGGNQMWEGSKQHDAKWYKEKWLANPNHEIERLRYAISTYSGQSGGAIWCNFSLNNKDDIFILGVHTLGLNAQYNSGVRITKRKFDFIMNHIKEDLLTRSLQLSFLETQIFHELIGYNEHTPEDVKIRNGELYLQNNDNARGFCLLIQTQKDIKEVNDLYKQSSGSPRQHSIAEYDRPAETAPQTPVSATTIHNTTTNTGTVAGVITGGNFGNFTFGDINMAGK